MAEYESIHGTRVRYLTSDPTLNSSYEGQVWYNSTAGTNKALVQIKATSSGGNMGTGRYGVGGAGTQTAGLAFTGSPGSSPYLSNVTAAQTEWDALSDEQKAATPGRPTDITLP